MQSPQFRPVHWAKDESGPSGICPTAVWPIRFCPCTPTHLHPFPRGLYLSPKIRRWYQTCLFLPLPCQLPEIPGLGFLITGNKLFTVLVHNLLPRNTRSVIRKNVHTPIIFHLSPLSRHETGSRKVQKTRDAPSLTSPERMREHFPPWKDLQRSQSMSDIHGFLISPKVGFLECFSISHFVHLSFDSPHSLASLERKRPNKTVI